MFENGFWREKWGQIWRCIHWKVLYHWHYWATSLIGHVNNANYEIYFFYVNVSHYYLISPNHLAVLSTEWWTNQSEFDWEAYKHHLLFPINNRITAMLTVPITLQISINQWNKWINLSSLFKRGREKSVISDFGYTPHKLFLQT